MQKNLIRGVEGGPGTHIVSFHALGGSGALFCCHFFVLIILRAVETLKLLIGAKKIRC